MDLQEEQSRSPQPVLERLQGRPGDDRYVVARELVLGQQFAHFHLDEFEQLRVVYHVGFVEVHDDVGHAHLTGEQDVLTGLRHRTIGRRHDQDRSVHLSGAGDHVLNVVRVAGAVHVSVVTILSLILHVGGSDGDAALPLLGSVVDGVEAPDRRCPGCATPEHIR